MQSHKLVCGKEKCKQRIEFSPAPSQNRSSLLSGMYLVIQFVQ